MELPEDDPTLCACCERERKERIKHEQQITQLQGVDISMTRIKKREQVFLNPGEWQTSRSNRASTSGDPNGLKLIEDEDLNVLKERLKVARTPVVVHFYKEELKRRLEKLEKLFSDRCGFSQLLQIPVLNRRLVELQIGIKSLPSLAVFKDGRLLQDKAIDSMMKNGVMNVNKVLEFLRSYLSGFSSDEESESDSECEICDRRYPHQHVLPSTISRSEDSCDDEDEF